MSEDSTLLEKIRARISAEAEAYHDAEAEKRDLLVAKVMAQEAARKSAEKAEAEAENEKKNLAEQQKNQAENLKFLRTSMEDRRGKVDDSADDEDDEEDWDSDDSTSVTKSSLPKVGMVVKPVPTAEPTNTHLVLDSETMLRPVPPKAAVQPVDVKKEGVTTKSLLTVLGEKIKHVGQPEKEVKQAEYDTDWDEDNSPPKVEVAAQKAQHSDPKTVRSPLPSRPKVSSTPVTKISSSNVVERTLESTDPHLVLDSETGQYIDPETGVLPLPLRSAVSTPETAVQPEAVAVQPEAVAVQPEAVAVQPEAVAVQPEAVAVQPKAVVQPEEEDVDLASLFNDDHFYASAATAPVEDKKKIVTPKSFSTELHDKLESVKNSELIAEAEREAEERAQKFKKETAPVSPTKQENGEHNKGFNRIRQRNIPFQYVSTAALEKNKLFNKMKASIEKKENAPVVEPEKTVSVLAPVSTADTDRDYALALHLDELQRSAKASDRQLADDPDYIRSLQEAYDNGSKPGLSTLTADAQKEVQHQNLDKEPAVTAVERVAPKPQPQTTVAQNQGLYMAQSLMLMMLVDMRAFDACGAQVFISYTCVCMSCRESLSIGRDGTMSYNMSQAVSYSNTTLTLSDNGKGDVMYRASSTELSYQRNASLSCSHYGFFSGAGRSIPRIDMDRVGSISLPAPAAA